MTAASSITPQYVITLVHGTYARDADWVNDPQSPLRQRLTTKLGAVDFRILKWTGENSDAARYAGADDLRVMLQNLLSDDSNTRYFVVGHSHGGNVILRALDGFSEANRIAGVVTLATPFINCKARDVERIARTFRRATPVLATLWLMLSGSSTLSIVQTFNFGICFVLAPLLWFKVFTKNGWFVVTAKAKQDELIAEHDHPGDVEVPFLSVATHVDEADIVLRAGTWAAESIVRLDVMFRGLIYILWALCIGLLLWSFWRFFNGVEEPWLPLAFSVLVVFLRVMLAFVRTTVIGIGAGVRGVTRSLLFGSSGFVKNALVQYWTSKEPTGVANCEFRLLDVDKSRNGLRHSAVYTTPEILDEIGDWIAAQK